MKPGIIRLLWIIYFLCVIPALVTLMHRSQLDNGFNSVAVVADYVQLLELAQTEDQPIDNVLERVRDESDITHLAILEDTPQFLAQRGLCTVVEGIGWPGWSTPEERDEIERNRGREPDEAGTPETNWPLLMGLEHDKTHLIFSDPEIYERISQAAEERYHGLVSSTAHGWDGGVVSLSGEPKIILEWGLGFDPDLVEHLEGMGFKLYPRLRNYPGFTEQTIGAVLDETGEMFPGSFIIFDGDSVLGGNGLIDITSQAIQSLDLNIGWVEFAEQRGAQTLSCRLPDRTARVHSIEDEEMEVITPDRAVARYLRSVRERAVRIVYLKPFLLPVDQSNRLDKSINMFGNVNKELESNGFTTGEPSLISSPVSAGFFTRLAAIVLFGLGLFLLCPMLNIKVNWTWLIVFMVGAFIIGLIPLWNGYKLIALGIAVISPTLAVARLSRAYDGVWGEIRKLRITSLWPAIGHWLGAVAITLTGALLIGASMINESTLLQIDAFSGVKIALYFPILLTILIGVQIILPRESRTLAGALSWLLNLTLKMWHVLLGVAGLILLFIMLDRSGNFPLLPVAEWENDIRGWFETLLYARPRTKEMFIGHPALILGLYLGLSTINIRRPLMYAGVVIGSIALTSMTNTFCHIHTPVDLSVFRTIAGGVIGGVIGIILGAIILGLVRRGKKHFT